METFIAKYKNAVSSETCKGLIKDFNDNSQYHNPGHVFKSGEASIDEKIKKSTDLVVHGFDASENTKSFIKELVKCKDDYVKRFPYLNTLNYWDFDHVWNIQHYKPGEGFFQWHCEASAGDYRILAWMLNLNTVKEGGQTEFAHGLPSVEPIEGQISIWPAGWTHYHRGVVAPNEEKYIATGWIQYI